jgi:hypothetical protein
LPQKTFRVLDLLDKDTLVLEMLLPATVGETKVEVVGGIIQDPYNFDQNEAPQIETLTSSGNIDYVVVGNNMGQGVHRAYAINKNMKEKTCVVWILYETGDPRRYQHIGFDTFMSRHKLKAFITHYLQTG